MASKHPQASRRGAASARSGVNEELIGKLYAAHQQGVAGVIETLSPAERAEVAVFCYQRAHLREVGLAVAATCDQWSLVNAAGRAGEAIYASSRTHKALERVAPVGRRKVTLATLIPSPPLADLDDDIEDAPEHEPETAPTIALRLPETVDA